MEFTMSIGAVTISPAVGQPERLSPLARDTARATGFVNTTNNNASNASTTTLTPEALKLVDDLKARDTEVRQHEQAHLAAAGGLAISGATYTYQRGPNGVNYAIGGEVQIDTSPGATPEETIARAASIQAAASAPAEPSGADRAVAAAAQQMAAQARTELARQEPDSTGGAAAVTFERMARSYGADAGQPAAAPTVNVYA
jgi:hypothetical protein